MAEGKVSVNASLRAAQEALGKGQDQEVVKLCKAVLKQDRSNYDAFVLLGAALLQNKQVEPAEKALRKAVGINDSKLAAWQRLVELYETTGSTEDLVETCRMARERAKGLGKMDLYYKLTRRLVSAFVAASDYRQACSTWQEVLDSTSVPEDVISEAILGLTDMKYSVLEKEIQEEFTRRLSEHNQACLRSSGETFMEETISSGSSLTVPTEDIRMSVEEEFSGTEESNDLEHLLDRILLRPDTASERYHELLLRLLLRKTRAHRQMKGKEWRTAKLRVLQQCLSMILFQNLLLGYEIAARLLEDDDRDEIFKEAESGNEGWKEHSEPLTQCLGRLFAHLYPQSGIALASLGMALQHHDRPEQAWSLERRRVLFERALSREDICASGWQALAEIHVQQGSYDGALECVRRGLQAIHSCQSLYGLGMGVIQMKLHFTLGERHLACQLYAEAASAFQYVAQGLEQLARKNEDLIVAANQGLAKVALAQGNVELARSQLRSLLSSNAGSHWAIAELGWLAYQNGEDEEASRYLERAVAMNANDASYHWRLALVYWRLGSNIQSFREKACSHFLQSVKLNPNQSDAFRYLGQYYKSKNDAPRASRCYQKCIGLDPDDEEAGMALCDILDKGGQHVLEMDVCREVSQRSRRAFWAWRHLGFLQAHRKEWTEAVQNLQHALRGYVTDADLWEALGLAYQNLGKLTAALKAYDRSISLGNSSPVYVLVQSGTILLLLASYAKAIDVFKEALIKAPQHIGALCGLGEAMLGRARECLVVGAFSWSADLAEDAICRLLQAATICGNLGSYWKLLGDLQVTYAQALPFATLGLLESYSYDVGDTLLEKLRASIESWRQSRVDSLNKATRSYQRALHLCPSRGSLYSDLGVAHDLISSLRSSKDIGKTSWSPAVRAVWGGLRVEGGEADLWVTLGMVAKHRGLRQHAFIQALRIDRTHAYAWGCLGQLYIREGHEDLARDAFDLARSSNPALPLPWAGMAFVHSFIESDKDLQEAYASCRYAVQLSPTVEVQLGLGKLAVSTNQLENAEVYTGLEQAVQHAPNRAEVHNLRGLVYESREDTRAAIRAFILARGVFVLTSAGQSGSLRMESAAISLNLARVLCKAGEAKASVGEYKRLWDLGYLRSDAGALRGYAVALWDSGSRDEAITVAKTSVEIEAVSTNREKGMSLIAKMIYCKFGPSRALNDIRALPNVGAALLNPSLFLTALAVAVMCGEDRWIAGLVNGRQDLFDQDVSVQAHLLIAAAKQILEGRQDYEASLKYLQKALHVYPHSLSLRTRIGQLLLKSSSGEKAHLVSRCCGLSSHIVQYNANYGSLCTVLASVSYACAQCGNLESSNFASCQGCSQRSDSLLRDLQRWTRKEPWSLEAHFHLALTYFHRTRGQNYPAFQCRVLWRTASAALALIPKADQNALNSHRTMRLLLLVVISESELQLGRFEDAMATMRTASEFRLSAWEVATATLQLARCHAALQDFSSVQKEIGRARKSLQQDDVEGLIRILELERYCKLQDSEHTVEVCTRAIIRKPVNEQMKWTIRLQLAVVNSFVMAGDLYAGQSAASEMLALLPENTVWHLLHGALCLELVLGGSHLELLSAAVRSLSKAMIGSGEGAIPLTSVLLFQALVTKGISKSGDFFKWERKLWSEWLAWPSDCRPAELYFQMGLLATKAQGTLLGIAGTAEVPWSAKAWLQRAVHLRPDSISYWTSLHQQ